MRQWLANLRARFAAVPGHVWLGLAIGVVSVILGIWAIRRQQSGQPLLPSVGQAVPADAGGGAATPTMPTMPTTSIATPVTDSAGSNGPPSGGGTGNGGGGTGGGGGGGGVGIGAFVAEQLGQTAPAPLPVHYSYFADGVTHQHGIVNGDTDSAAASTDPAPAALPIHPQYDDTGALHIHGAVHG